MSVSAILNAFESSGGVSGVVVIAILLLSSLGSAIWGMNRFFTKPSGKTSGMRVIALAGVCFGALHLAMVLYPGCVVWKRALLAAPIYCASLALFWWALVTNMKAPLSAAFSPDVPRHVVRSGPYRFVRHPFYSSYILTWLAGPVATGQMWLFVTTATMAAIYYVAARAEERKFEDSALGDEYRRYRSTTGLFLPCIWRGQSSRRLEMPYFAES